MRRILSCIGLFLFIVGLLHSCIAGDKQKAGKMDECTENVKGKAELRDQQFPFPEILPHRAQDFLADALLGQL